jgi:hypothetical protein
MKLLVLAAVALAPALALACPVCGAGERPDATLIVAAMIAAPYVVTVLVVRAIRSAGDEP